MSPRAGYLILIIYLHLSDVRSLDCEDPSVVIECLYDRDSGHSCGLRLEQSLRLYNVVNFEVKKIHTWLDETVIHEEVDAIRELQWQLNDILSAGNVAGDSSVYVLYICRFRPFSCVRASRYRRESRVNGTNEAAISKMKMVQEDMRTRWALICYRMVWLERQSLPKHMFWRDESTGTFYCSLQSFAPWKYAMEISSNDFDLSGGTVKYENNMTVCRASIRVRSSRGASAVRCVVRFRTGIVRTIYLWEYGRFSDGYGNPPYLFRVFLVACVTIYLMVLFHRNVWSSLVSK